MKWDVKQSGDIQIVHYFPSINCVGVQPTKFLVFKNQSIFIPCIKKSSSIYVTHENISKIA